MEVDTIIAEMKTIVLKLQHKTVYYYLGQRETSKYNIMWIVNRWLYKHSLPVLYLENQN